MSRNRSSQRDARLRDLLRQGDPAAGEPGLSTEEIHAMRRAVLTAAPERRRFGLIPTLATGAAVTVALTVFTLAGRASGRSQDSASRLRPDLALSPTGRSPAAPLSAGTRQCAVDDAARQAPVRKA